MTLPKSGQPICRRDGGGRRRGWMSDSRQFWSARAGIVEGVSQNSTITGGVAGARRRAALPGRGQQGPPLRRRVLHRGDLDRHLLPAVLPGDHAEAGEHAVLPQRGGGPGGGLPGLQAVPPGRLPRLARVEHPGRHGGPGDAADRRRGGRPGRRRGPGPAARLRAAPGAPAGHRRTGRRTARHRPRAARADGADPDRDHRAAAVRDRLRGRLRQHQAVQRDHPRGLRGDPDRAAAGARPGATDPPAAAAALSGRGGARADPAPAGLPGPDRRGADAGLPGRPGHPGGGGGARGPVPADHHAAERAGDLVPRARLRATSTASSSSRTCAT